MLSPWTLQGVTHTSHKGLSIGHMRITLDEVFLLTGDPGQSDKAQEAEEIGGGGDA